MRSVGEPIDVKRARTRGYAPSLHSLVVAAACAAAADWGWAGRFTDALARDEVRRGIAARVAVEATRSARRSTVPVPGGRSGTHARRDELTQRLVNRGGPGDPLTDDELRLKVPRLRVARGLARSVAQIEDAAKRLDALSSIGELLAPACRGE